MKICKIWIKNYDQFQNLELDFTDPATGEPLDKVCFIGSNGTGKSKILNFINGFLKSMFNASTVNKKNFTWLVKVRYNNETYYVVRDTFYGHHFKLITKKPDEITEQKFIANVYENVNDSDLKYLFMFPNIDEIKNPFFKLGKNIPPHIMDRLCMKNISETLGKEKYGIDELVIYTPSESQTNQLVDLVDVPKSTLDAALKLFTGALTFHTISTSSVSEFWTQLIFLMKKRESDFQEFLNNEENKMKVYGELEVEFNKENPKIETALAIIWNQILAKANLELDLETLKKPVQLSENLQAYIRLKSSKNRIPYNELSTGIRNFIFRLGHIYSLYFNQEIKNGFLLVDEPENSLYPDFLFDLIEIYQKVVLDKNNENNTQMFFATHNPIVAAQFKPHERILLDWNEDGSVSARKGRAPEGDDPNDVLRQDFELTDLMGKQGKAMWVKYVELKSQLSHARTFDEKEKLISEINEIGSLYNF